MRMTASSDDGPVTGQRSANTWPPARP